MTPSPTPAPAPAQFSPGTLVRARGREWLVLESTPHLKLRPLSGSETEIETILPALEQTPVASAGFAPPDPQHFGGRNAARLLADALRLSLRRGAGPFRAAGNLAFQPHAYQLAPLMMALRQQTIRLLIADDVGVGKTIEAALILRELLDRGDITRFSILCPPHLIEQWLHELQTKFAIAATPVTASSAAKLERDIPTGSSIFEKFPHTIVSMDFIKSPRRASDFQRACPSMLVIDEAHAAVGSGHTRHQRYELTRPLTEDQNRHIILLTATPHSGNDTAFHNLLGLLNPQFAALQIANPEERRRLREKLAAHFIQRRRADIKSEEWSEQRLFPTHETAEHKYILSGDYESFYRDILSYCAEIVTSEQGDLRQRRAFWSKLALMRCVGSSPAAAARALRNSTRSDTETSEQTLTTLTAHVLDDEETGKEQDDDLEPAATTETDPRLQNLIARAESLAANTQADPKYKQLLKILHNLIKQNFSPIVFCRYIATANHLAETLRSDFPTHNIEFATGEFPPEEREDRIRTLATKPKRILIATDCLAEGINLQEWFDAVIHYDLSWNPTRHQQREGRIDRLGQTSPKVRSILIYGENNPVDGAVLKVILSKAKTIEDNTGVRVPLPDNDGSLTKALMFAVLLHAKQHKQLDLSMDLETSQPVRDIETAWRNASEQEKKSRTIFAQHSIKPEQVISEWNKTRDILGTQRDTQCFTTSAMQRLNAALQPRKPRSDSPSATPSFIAPIHNTPPAVRSRFIAASLLHHAETTPLNIAFTDPPPPGCIHIHRNHPLTATLAETFFQRAIDTHARSDDYATLPRTGAWSCTGLPQPTRLLLLRLRHRLSTPRSNTAATLVEEATALAISTDNHQRLHSGDHALALLNLPSTDLDEATRSNAIQQGLDSIPALLPLIATHAGERAAILADDHNRARRGLRSQAQTAITPILPADIIGLYTLIPDPS